MKAYQRYDGYSQEDGSINVTAITNDDLDLGCANEEATWSFCCQNKEEFNKRCGKSRIGISGIQVFVFLDGTQI